MHNSSAAFYGDALFSVILGWHFMLLIVWFISYSFGIQNQNQ